MRALAWSLIALAFAMLARTDANAHGAITLTPWGSISISPLQSPTRVAAADIDANGTVDLVISCRDVEGRFGVIRRTPTGAWGPLEVIALGAQTDWIEVADMDQDGFVDLVLSIRMGHGRVAIMRGTGGGMFDPAVEVRAERNPARLALADFDGDGDRDVALVNWGSASVQAWRNGSQLSLGAMHTARLQPWATAIPFPFSLVAADLDGDGDQDLATASIGTKSLAIHLNDGNGGFSAGRSWTAPVVDGESVAIANIGATEIDMDGDIDIISNGLMVLSAQRTILWLNDGSGSFDTRIVAPGVPQGNAWCLAPADMDGDGDQDLLLGSALPGKLTVAEVDPKLIGSFVAMQTLSGGGFTREITAADLDADGDLDVVTADISTHTIYFYRNGAATLVPPGDAPSRVPPDSCNPDTPRATPPEADAGALAEWLAQWESNEGGVAGGTVPHCGAGSGLCEEAHATPGCVRTLCCEAVCELNPLCCEVAWDQMCVDAEGELCDDLNCPSEGACDEFHTNPGCADESCCQFLCAFDPFCCDTIWDEACAVEASAYCGRAACELPPDATVQIVDEICYERENEGCNRANGGVIEPACSVTYESSVTSDSPRDTDWYHLASLGCGRVRVRVESEFPLQGLVVRGACTGPLEVVRESVILPCATAQFDHTTHPADLFVVSAANGLRPFRSGLPCDQVDPDDPPPDPRDPPFVPGYFGLDYRVVFAPAPPIGDINEDGFVDGVDLTEVLSSWGQGGRADVDGSGSVDGMDLTAVLSNWS